MGLQASRGGSGECHGALQGRELCGASRGIMEHSWASQGIGHGPDFRLGLGILLVHDFMCWASSVQYKRTIAFIVVFGKYYSPQMDPKSSRLDSIFEDCVIKVGQRN